MTFRSRLNKEMNNRKEDEKEENLERPLVDKEIKNKIKGLSKVSMMYMRLKFNNFEFSSQIYKAPNIIISAAFQGKVF